MPHMFIVVRSTLKPTEKSPEETLKKDKKRFAPRGHK